MEAHVLVPLKKIDPKSRLAGELPLEERVRLMRGLLAGVVGAVREAGVERVTLVTGIDLKGYETWDDRDFRRTTRSRRRSTRSSRRRSSQSSPPTCLRFTPRTSRSCSPRRRSAGSRSRERSTAAPTPFRCGRPDRSHALRRAGQRSRPRRPRCRPRHPRPSRPRVRRRHAGRPRPDAGGRVLRLGYKACAEQFAPRELLDFSVAAERLGLEIVAVSDHFQPFRHTGGHGTAALPWLGAVGERTERALLGHERADADDALPPVDDRPCLRHARAALSRSCLPRRRHRRVAERDAGDRRRVAGRKGTADAARRGDRPDAPALDRRPRHVRGRSTERRTRRSTTSPTSPCRSTSPRRARSPAKLAGRSATASSSRAARIRRCTRS